MKILKKETVDGIRGGIARKESIASATSTQNSNVSGNNATNNLVQHQGDVSGPPFSSALSLKEIQLHLMNLLQDWHVRIPIQQPMQISLPFHWEF